MTLQHRLLYTGKIEDQSIITTYFFISAFSFILLTFVYNNVIYNTVLHD